MYNKNIFVYSLRINRGKKNIEFLTNACRTNYNITYLSSSSTLRKMTLTTITSLNSLFRRSSKSNIESIYGNYGHLFMNETNS